MYEAKLSKVGNEADKFITISNRYTSWIIFILDVNPEICYFHVLQRILICLEWLTDSLMLLIFPCCDSDYRPKQLQNTSSEIYDLLVKAFKVREDSSSITIFGFLKKRKANEIFDKLPEHIHYRINFDNPNIKRVMTDLLLSIFDSGFTSSQEQMEFFYSL